MAEHLGPPYSTGVQFFSTFIIIKKKITEFEDSMKKKRREIIIIIIIKRYFEIKSNVKGNGSVH